LLACAHHDAHMFDIRSRCRSDRARCRRDGRWISHPTSRRATPSTPPRGGHRASTKTHEHDPRFCPRNRELLASPTILQIIISTSQCRPSPSLSPKHAQIRSGTPAHSSSSCDFQSARPGYACASDAGRCTHEFTTVARESARLQASASPLAMAARRVRVGTTSSVSARRAWWT